jgi:hypothetical protein
LDLAQLEPLGKVAGIGGIAIGAVVLIIRGVIAKTSTVSVRQRAAMLRLVAMGAFAIGALGIVAWISAGISGGQHASTRGADSPAVIGGGSVTIGPAGPTAANGSARSTWRRPERDGEDRGKPLARDHLGWGCHRDAPEQCPETQTARSAC